MPVLPADHEKLVKQAVVHYWRTLRRQAAKQTRGTDHGQRTAVTGGKQMDGFSHLVRAVIAGTGMPDTSVYVQSRLQLPGFFRPTKKWDLLIVHKERLVAAVEFKSQVGPSFGNNFNNRTEEAVGTSRTSGRPTATGRSARTPSGLGSVG